MGSGMAVVSQNARQSKIEQKTSNKCNLNINTLEAKNDILC